MKTSLAAMSFGVVLAVLAGCSSTGSKTGGDTAAVEDRSIGSDGGAVSSGAAGAGAYDGQSLNDPNSPLSRRVIYFDFDSATITGADQDTLQAHGAYLAANPGARVTLEGHTDERGSREYNVALGDRRALSVQRVLELHGAAGSQVSVVSYGEEKPAADGHSEAAWRLNRRVEIMYQ